MKIKILSSAMKTFWYSDRIGEELIICSYDIHDRDNSFKSCELIHYIRNSDCTITELPESFCVKICDDIEKWNKYIKWLNKTYKSTIDGDEFYHYGVFKKGVVFSDTSFGTEIHIDDMIKHIDYMESQQHIKGGEQFSKESQLIAKMDKIIKEEKNMETQKLSRQGLKEIHSIACSSWKNVLEQSGSRNPLEDYIELTQEEVNKMFNACTKEQLPIVSKYLKQDDGSVDVTKFNVSGKGFCDNNHYIIRDREIGKYKRKSFLLSSQYSWEFREDELCQLCLMPTKKK